MPPPTSLSIATASLNRLVKEEASYHKELEQQTQRLQKLENVGTNGAADDEDDNREYLLNQEVCHSCYVPGLRLSALLCSSSSLPYPFLILVYVFRQLLTHVCNTAQSNRRD
jgi:hypothetical protein